MSEEHQHFINQFKENDKLCEKSTKKTLILEVFVIGIVCAMKTIQRSANFELNLIASLIVTLLTTWHFWDFKYRRELDSRKTEIILKGIDLERKLSFLKPLFFHDYMKLFNTVGKLGQLAFFDFSFLYFFSVSITQLLKSIDPALVTRLASSTQIRTFIICACLGFAYYRPIKALAHLKRELKHS